MVPSPQWKLVVDIGIPEAQHGVPGLSTFEEKQKFLVIMEQHMPVDKTASFAEYLPGFTSVVLLLTERIHSAREEELLKIAYKCFTLHKESGMSDRDAAWMTARDFMTTSRHEVPSHNGVLQGKLHGVQGKTQASGSGTDGDSRKKKSDATKSHSHGAFRSAPSFPAPEPSASLYEAPAPRPAPFLSLSGLHSLTSTPQFSAAVAPMAGSAGYAGPFQSTGEQDFSLGLSPALMPASYYTNDHGEPIPHLPALSAAQLSALLQAEGGFNFQLH
jgi:hypothetical protein